MHIPKSVILLVSIVAIRSQAQTAESIEIRPEEKTGFEDFSEIPLESLLNTEISVTTRGLSESLLDSPGIVSVVTREEILRSGARDLIDVLYLIPGFEFGVDIKNTTSPGFRGLWSGEGKLLVLLDGHEMHDISYLSNLFGNRFAVDWIERIEIIRGPGSVMYGGAAELAVVSITTRKAEAVNGLSVSFLYGQMLAGTIANNDTFDSTFGRNNLMLSVGKVFRDFDDLKLKFDLISGKGFRSDHKYTDVFGSSFWMAGRSRLDPFMTNLSAEWRSLKIQHLFEYYRITYQDAYDAIFDRALPLEFITSSLRLSYDWQLTDWLKLTPHFIWIYQRPWHQTAEVVKLPAYDVYWDPRVERLQAGFVANIEPLDFLKLQLGSDYTYDSSEDVDYGYPDPDDPAQTTHFIQNQILAAFLQVLAYTPYVNLSAGVRFEHHNLAGDAPVFRGGLTKKFGAFHFKLLASQALRWPPLEEQGMQPPKIYEEQYAEDYPEFVGVEPLGRELTTAFELELGYQFTEFLSLTVNGFDLTVEDALGYLHNPNGFDLFWNYGKAGTRGVEFDARFKLRDTYANLNASFYDATDKNNVGIYQVPGKKHVLIGFTPLKVAFNGGLAIARDLYANLSAVYLSSQRYGISQVDADDNPVYSDFGDVLLLNLFLTYRNVFVDGLWVGAGVYNLLNQRMVYVQPVNNNLHAPLPGPSLEVLFKIGFDYSLPAG